MIVTMDLKQATYHVEKTQALQLKEVKFKLDNNMKKRKRLVRTPLYELTILAEVNGQTYEFSGYDLDEKLIAQLEEDPSTFLVGAEPPFLCGTNWPNSSITDVVEANYVPLDALFITDGQDVIATIYHEEIPMLINWLKQFI